MSEVTGISKDEICRTLSELGHILEIAGSSPFKVRAFANGSRALENWQGDLVTLVKDGKVTSIQGIGKGLAGVIEDLVLEGESSAEEEIRSLVPESLLQLLRIAGLGPKKVRVLYEELQIESVDALEQACQENQVQALAGFGQTSENSILKGINNLRRFAGRHLVSQAREVASRFLSAVEVVNGVERAEVAGSLRRHRETIGDIDVLVATNDPEPVRDAFMKVDGISEVMAEGETKSRILSEEGVGVDLRIVEPTAFASALHYFTGSKEHNTRLRQRARERGWKLNEYGLWNEAGEALETPEETDIFEHLGMAWVPPELREDTGEFEIAESLHNKGAVWDELISMEDVQGVLHCHSTWSDGKGTLREMIQAASDLGWLYYGTGDHSRTASYAGGLSIEQLAEQRLELEELRKEFPHMTILQGIESDILADGSLDYPDEVLAELDYVVISVHSSFSLPRDEQTARIEKALRHPATTVWGHPTGRLLLQRDGYEIDLDHLLSVAAEEKVIVELNANPKRLDIDWRWGNRIRELGVDIGIHPDAHSTHGLKDVLYGVAIARKMGFTAEQVTNCLDPQDYLQRLKRCHQPEVS
ncbi:MAG: hypothetical protein CBC13_03095 [Planctomycetia bacterium TMED53]|nr:MAG: hypothetical protein CBC13_03095 [Planctomycetia bacterium TMED53]